MSVSEWMSVDTAEKYHAEDNYYTKTLGIFRGNDRILSILGIKEGQVISKRKGKKIFNQLLRGINPKTGKSLARKSKEGQERRSGFDVSFSPSKSVSLVYEFGSEVTRKAIAEAHQKAVQKAMKSVANHIQVKVPSKHKKNKQKLAKSEIVYAEIEHDVSRESKNGTIDPEIHTHNYIYNLGLDVNGGDKIRSIFNDDLYHHKSGGKEHLINQIGSEYRLTLAAEMEKIGFKMEVTDEKQSFYEVAGVDRDTIMEFSQRAQDIQVQGDEYLQWRLEKATKEAKENGKSEKEIEAIVKEIEDKFGYRDVKIASQNNKIAKKNNVDRDAVRLENRQRFLDFKGIDSQVWVENILVKNKVLIEEKRKELLNEVAPALTILAEKEGVSVQELIEKLTKEEGLWDSESKEKSPLITNVREALDEKNIERATKIVELSIRSVEQESSTFTPKMVLKRAMEMATQDKIPPELLKIEIEKAVTSGELIPFSLQNRNIVLSSKKLYYAEQEIFPLVEAGKGKMLPLLNAEQKAKMENYRINHEDFSKMNEGQVAMSNFIFSSTDKYLAIKGDAGTGKTFSMAYINEAIKKIDPSLAKKMVGISFTGKASAGLEADSGIKSRTLDSFLMSQKNSGRKQEKGRIIIVDEATMVGSLKMQELFKVAEENDDRIVFVGDPKQFAAVSAGSLFKDLLDNDVINKLELTETMRQKNTDIKDIIKDMKNQKWGKAIIALKKRGSLIELEDSEAVLAAGTLYIDSIKDEKMGEDIVDRSLIIASTNIVRNAENTFLRQALKDEGIIGNEEHVFDTYATVNVSGIKQFMAIGIAEAKPDFIIPQGGVRGLNVKETYEFGRVSEDKKSIILLDKDSKKIEIDIEKDGEKLGYFKLEKRDFVKSDVIIFTKNNNELGFKNGMRGKVLEVTDTEITAEIDGKVYKVNPEEYPYLDHGYAVTDYKSQGATTGHVIALAHSRMASQNSFYTQLTRCKYDATIITSNIKKFTENAHKTGVAQSTVGMERIPNDAAIENLWGIKIPEKEEVLSPPKQENPNIKKNIKAVAGITITIPDFIKKSKELGVYVDLRRGVAIFDGERIKLHETEVQSLKKQLRINYSKQKQAEKTKPKKAVNTEKRRPTKRGTERAKRSEPVVSSIQDNENVKKGTGRNLRESAVESIKRKRQERETNKQRSISKLQAISIFKTESKVLEKRVDVLIKDGIPDDAKQRENDSPKVRQVNHNTNDDWGEAPRTRQYDVTAGTIKKERAVKIESTLTDIDKIDSKATIGSKKI